MFICCCDPIVVTGITVAPCCAGCVGRVDGFGAVDCCVGAVAAKFAPYKEFIDIRQKQLEAIAPLLSKAESKQAAAQKLKTIFHSENSTN